MEECVGTRSGKRPESRILRRRPCGRGEKRARKSGRGGGRGQAESREY